MADYEIYIKNFYLKKCKKIIDSFFKSLKKQSTLLCKRTGKRMSFHSYKPLWYYFP